ncbi:DinB family protein [Halocola ammonii]
MRINQNELIADLEQRTHDNLRKAKKLAELNESKLNKKPDSESWSALEAIEHLNRYGEFYIPEIGKRLKDAKRISSCVTFKSGWLGNKFAKMMLPDAKSMKTFSSMNPAGSNLDKSVLTTFITQQQEILDLLDKAKSVNLKKVKTSISISKWIKLRLGDTLRVVTYHNQRHIQQAERAVG